MEDAVLEEKEDMVRYNLWAFFFSFGYYFYRGLWVFGVIAWVCTIVLPLQVYFAVSFIESMVLLRLNRMGKCFGNPAGKKGIVVALLSVLVAFVLKAWLYWWLGGFLS